MRLGIGFLNEQGEEVHVSCETRTLKVRGIATPFELSTDKLMAVLDAV